MVRQSVGILRIPALDGGWGSDDGDGDLGLVPGCNLDSPFDPPTSHAPLLHALPRGGGGSLFLLEALIPSPELSDELLSVHWSPAIRKASISV